MAANSIRERIIKSNIALVQGVDSIKTVKRTLMEHSELKNFALTQLPVVAVVGGIPVPVEKHSNRRTGKVDLIISSLTVDFFIYFLENEKMDEIVSSLMDDLWVALYQDQTRGGLVLETEVKPETAKEVWSPFVAFKITCVHKYKHTTEGI